MREERSHRDTVSFWASDASVCARRHLCVVVDNPTICTGGVAQDTRKGLKGADMKKILVADDETSIAELLQQALETEGYETYKVTQSLRFYDAVIQHKPDLILLDLLMPYLEGEDELRILQLNPETKNIPVIVVTAMLEAVQEQEKYRQLGVVEIVTKPFDLDKLTSLIKRVIG